MNFPSQKLPGVCLCTALTLLVAGCASPGPPRPPSLHLPERVTALHAERQGDAVVLSFNTPIHASDGQLLTAPVLATLCRSVGAGPCKPTASFPGKTAIAGPVHWKDVLPPDLASGPEQLLTYRVELFSPRGRSAGPSEPAFAAAGRAPRPVEALQAEGSRRGIVLRWKADPMSGGEVLLERDDLAAPAPKPSKANPPKRPLGHKGHAAGVPAKPQKPGATSASTWLHSEQDASDAGGMIDNSARAGEPYRYTAVRSRKTTVHGKELELRSEVSPAVTMMLQDIYPPAVPHGLQAVSFAPDGSAPAADLVWDPNTEGDLAGYNVYRETLQAGGGYGDRRSLSQKPVALPGFHDATIARGVGYRYTVTAVDRKGNESAASGPAVLEPTP